MVLLAIARVVVRGMPSVEVYSVDKRSLTASHVSMALIVILMAILAAWMGHLLVADGNAGRLIPYAGWFGCS